MSGPPYPRPVPAPNSNAIGTFSIGISPLGDLPQFDVWASVISQYANSPILTAMITSFNAAMDMTVPIENFYDLIFNVLTAQGYGLDVWGRIVVAPRTLSVNQGSVSTFGFNEPGNDWVGFNQAPFTQGPQIGSNVTLLDDQYRALVLAKAATNIWDGSIAGLNKILIALFQGRGAPFVRDTLDMKIAYVFPFSLTPLDQAIILGSGVLPQPAGVVISIGA